MKICIIAISLSIALAGILQAGKEYPIRDIPENSAKFKSDYDSYWATEVAKQRSQYIGISKKIQIKQHIKGVLYLAKFKKVKGTDINGRAVMETKLVAVELRPHEKLHTDGKWISADFDGETSTYQYINTLGAKSTVELWKESIPMKFEIMSKADFYTAIKAGKSFVITVESKKVGGLSQRVTVKW